MRVEHRGRVVQGVMPNGTIAPTQPEGLSRAAFSDLCRAWRGMGLWLSIWSPTGELVECDDQGPRFWNLCWKSGEWAKKALSAASRAVRERGTNLKSRWQVAACGDCPGASLLVIPIRRAARTQAVCIAAGLGSAGPEEERRRFCDRQRLDYQALEAAAEATPRITTDELERWAPILTSALESAVKVEAARGEIDSLTRNLDSTYEELQLLYRIGGELRLGAETGPMLQRVAGEVVSVSRAAGVAFVTLGDEVRALAGEPTPIASSGIAGVDPAEIGRLAAQIGELLDLGGERFILNDAGADARFSWARGWLKHCVALPMRQQSLRIGVMLAVNCNDTGDFTSVDVQLFRAVADRVTSFLHKQRLYDDLADLLMGMLNSLISAIDAKDPYTCGHSERVAFISRRLAEVLGLSAAESQRVYLAGLLHDVGKIGVPDAILAKPGRLTAEEFGELKKHPEMGARILKDVSQIRDLLPGVLHHHERMDGKGYPRGLAGNGIPRLARILCLADSLDAMTTTRTYRTFLPPKVAIAELRRCAGTQFDPRMADALLSLDLAKLLEEAHALAGSRLPRDGESGAAPALVREGSFSTRPIVTREMFATQVAPW